MNKEQIEQEAEKFFNETRTRLPIATLSKESFIAGFNIASTIQQQGMWIKATDRLPDYRDKGIYTILYDGERSENEFDGVSFLFCKGTALEDSKIYWQERPSSLNSKLLEALRGLVAYSRKLYVFAQMPWEDFSGTPIAKSEKILKEQ